MRRFARLFVALALMLFGGAGAVVAATVTAPPAEALPGGYWAYWYTWNGTRYCTWYSNGRPNAAYVRPCSTVGL